MDRSFTDLGYIGYCDGINLEDLDSCPNWQFLWIIDICIDESFTYLFNTNNN